MAQKQVLLPLETTLRLEIARLTHALAQADARLLHTIADHQQVTTVLKLLQQAGISLPVPLAATTFDVERGCLLYDDPETPATPDGADRVPLSDQTLARFRPLDGEAVR